MKSALRNMNIHYFSLEILLQEVNLGQYENFRAYLHQNKLTNLDLTKQANKVDLYLPWMCFKGHRDNSFRFLGTKYGRENAEVLCLIILQFQQHDKVRHS